MFVIFATTRSTTIGIVIVTPSFAVMMMPTATVAVTSTAMAVAMSMTTLSLFIPTFHTQCKINFWKKHLRHRGPDGTGLAHTWRTCSCAQARRWRCLCVRPGNEIVQLGAFRVSPSLLGQNRGDLLDHSVLTVVSGVVLDETDIFPSNIENLLAHLPSQSSGDGPSCRFIILSKTVNIGTASGKRGGSEISRSRSRST